MRHDVVIAALALALTQATAQADSRVVRLCGKDHVNEITSQTDVRANPKGYYVASLGEQLDAEDPRVILSADSEFYLCTRSAATPDMDATKAILLMNERVVKYLFVPSTPGETGGLPEPGSRQSVRAAK